MASGTRIRTSTKDDLTTVQAILKHPMDTGNSRDPETGHYHFVAVMYGHRLDKKCRDHITSFRIATISSIHRVLEDSLNCCQLIFC